MAEQKRNFELDHLERQWVYKALDTQLKVLVRARLAELPGSEIHTLRGREVDRVALIKEKFA